MSFINKVVIVTGASSGIGAATAIEFAKEGAKVAIVGRNEDKLNSVEEECSKVGSKPLKIVADVTTKEEAERIVKETAAAFGHIDILINNAGLVRFAKVEDSHILNAYEDLMNTNVRAPIYLTHLTTPYLIKTKGSIINVSSIAGERQPNSPTMNLYAMSKAAISHFSRGAAAELAIYGVRVNTVSPGPVETDIMRNAGLNKSLSDLNIELPLGRLSEPIEIADIILYLSSDKAKAITGSNYVVDNGFLLK